MDSAACLAGMKVLRMCVGGNRMDGEDVAARKWTDRELGSLVFSWR